MMSVSALIAEDEAPQRRELCDMLQALWPELNIVAQCSDGFEAMEALVKKRPDIAFVDIRMPGVSGLEVARAASGVSHIVFTTAYEEYALQAFEHGALDYLLKPVQRERLLKAVARLKESVHKVAPADVHSVVDALQLRLNKAARDAIKWITASIGNTTKMFAIDEVLFFRAEEKYTRVVTATDEAHIRMSLKELTDALDPTQFWQVHRSAIVRVGAIDSVHRDQDGKLNLQIRGRPEVLPVSQAFHYRFKGM